SRPRRHPRALPPRRGGHRAAAAAFDARERRRGDARSPLTMRIETLAVHAGHAVDPTTGAVTPPIHLTTTFGRDADGSLPHGFIYARSDNPTRQELERGLAALEGGAVALAFASGMAATAAVFQSLLPGDH